MRENKIERDHEHVYVVCLAANNKILNIELVSLGAINKLKEIHSNTHPAARLKPHSQETETEDD